MIPPFWSSGARELPIDWEDAVQRTAYQDLSAAVHGRTHPHHHLLGHAEPIQPTAMEVDCHVVRTLGRSACDSDYSCFRDPPRVWANLLQLDSAPSPADAPGWMWGDMGCLYYFVRRDELAAARFDECHRIQECG